MPSTSEDAPAAGRLGGSLRSARGLLSSGLEKLTEWTTLVPIVLIGAALVFFGFRWVYLAALIAGVVVFNYWGRSMAFSDPKLALVVNVEKGEVAPLFIGRKRWADAEKSGRPSLSFRTPGGLSVEILRSYDPATNTVVYPMDDKFSDIMIASIPERYGELIDELVVTSRKNMTLSTEKELRALSIAQDHIEKFAAEFNKVITPRDAPTDKKEVPADDSAVQ